MKIEGAAVLVTGANRGLGATIAQSLLDSGAKVYGGAHDATTITHRDIIPVLLDVTNADDVASAALTCRDVSIVVNNAGILRKSASLAAGGIDAARAEMETNYFGSMRMARAFAPVLHDNGGGALVNVLSVLSFISMPQGATYSASKAAAWSLTNALRIELRRQGTLVVTVHAGFIDTDMAAGVAGDKVSPQSVADQIVATLADDAEEVLADATSVMVKAALPNDLTALYPALQAQWDREMVGHYMTLDPIPSTDAGASYKSAPTRVITAGGVDFAYRELGPHIGIPVIFLTHLAANLDDWDPRVVDGIAARQHVITFDNRGVGASSGKVPETVEAMAHDAVTFIRALGFEQVDVLGFSLGGMIAQSIALEEPSSSAS